MVGQVLTTNRGITEKAGQSYHLAFLIWAQVEVSELIRLCDEKIAQLLRPIQA